MTKPVRPAAMLAATVVSALALTACQAGQSAQTSQPYNPVDGRNVNVPADATFDEPYLAVRDAVVVASGTDATLVMTLVNRSLESDVLESATLDGKPVDLSDGPITLVPNQSISVGHGEGPTATQSAFGSVPGDWVDLTLSFQAAGDTSLQVLVVPYGDIYVPVHFAPGVVPSTASS